MLRRLGPVLQNLPFPVGQKCLGHLEHYDSRSLNWSQKDRWLLRTVRLILRSVAPFPRRMLKTFPLIVMECYRLTIAEE